MKALPILAAVLGIGVMLALVGYFGAGAVIHSLFAAAGLGFPAASAIHLALLFVVGLVVAVAAVVAFLVVQRHGFDYFERIARILGRGWAGRSAAGAAALHGALREIYRRPVALWLCFGLHLACWIASAAEAWLVLRLAGEPLPFSAVLVLESMLYAVRTSAFVVPNAVGVQEGAYILLGATFGLTPEMALALSLLKRARDLAIGLPTIGVWQALEGGRILRRRRTPQAEQVPST